MFIYRHTAGKHNILDYKMTYIYTYTYNTYTYMHTHCPYTYTYVCIHMYISSLYTCIANTHVYRGAPCSVEKDKEYQ